jgi:hypothetical protein
VPECRRGFGLALLAALAWLVPAASVAQVPDTAQRADTLRRDTTDLFTIMQKGDEEAKVRLPVPHTIGTERLLPPLARIVLPRDSIDFRNAETLGDLLAEVGGVYLWRGGWVGRPELPNYLGRGATGVEYIVDGVPFIPVGPDSLAVDPSLLPLGGIERIEIDRLPGLLRVHLFLRNHDRLAPRTRLNIGRGNFDQARYDGQFEKRFRFGLGVSLGAGYNVTNGWDAPVGDFNQSNGLLQVNYLPSPRFGAQIRWLLTGVNREANLSGTDTIGLPVKGDRNEVQARVFHRTGGDSLGWRTDLIVSRTAWNGGEGPDTVDQSFWRTGVTVSNRTPTASLSGSLWYGSRWTTMDGRLSASWAPTGILSVAVEEVHQRHEGDRSSTWLGLQAGVRLPLGATASGMWRTGSVVARPAMAGDGSQDLSDREARVAWQRSWFGLEGSYTRLADFQPVAYRQFSPVIDSIAPSGPTEWITASVRVAPRQWFTLSGWYSTPLGPLPEGLPPHHSMITAAIRSKFLRTFPSGIFDLKLAISMENWSTGTLGRDPSGAPVTLAGATFVRGLIQMQFLGFIIYYDRYNILNSPSGYVPGFPLPVYGTTYGVRWTFLN